MIKCGICYVLDMIHHLNLIENTKLQYSYSDVLLKKGWVQIHQPERWEHFQMTHCKKITNDQEQKIERYESIHGKLKDNDVRFLLM